MQARRPSGAFVAIATFKKRTDVPRGLLSARLSLSGSNLSYCALSSAVKTLPQHNDPRIRNIPDVQQRMSLDP